MSNQLGLNRISPSMIAEYKKCPKKFYYSSWLGLKLPQPMRHLEFGTAIHAAIDNIYEQYNEDGWKLAEFNIVWKQFTDRFSIEHVDLAEFSKDPSKYPDPVKARRDCYAEMVDDAREILKEYWARKEELRKEFGVNPTKFEIIMKIPVFHPETKEKLEVPMSGRLDAINEVEEAIVEFKTSKAKYDPHDSRMLPQSLCYNLLHYCKYGKMPKFLTYVVMLKGRKKDGDRLQVLKYSYDKTDISTFFEEVKILLEKIKKREFDRPSVGHDRWCDCVKFEEALKIN